MHSSLRAAPVRPSAPICRALEAIEAASAHAQYLAAPPEEAKRLGLRTEQYGSTTAILMRKSKNLLYNRLIGWGQASTATVGQLDRFIACAREHRAEAVGVPLGPCARPSQLRQWLEERGFESGYPGAKLWRDASPLPKKTSGRGISVRLARREDAGTWVDVVAQVWRAFGSRRPWFEARAAALGWRHYLAWIDGEPVATGALFVGTVGGRQVPPGGRRYASGLARARRTGCRHPPPDLGRGQTRLRAVRGRDRSAAAQDAARLLPKPLPTGLPARLPARILEAATAVTAARWPHRR